MQIRLTVVDPLGSPSEPRGRAAACDVLVTAPAGTALAAVASGLASAVGGEGAGQHDRGRELGGGPVVLYAGAERLDGQRCTLGEPPLTDGAVLSLGAPAEPGPDVDEVAAQLHVVAGPDAGGVHLLHGGQIHIGRSADADVPLDDPDVSRLHCAVTVTPEGRVAVADLGSTNGTTLDGTPVGTRAVRFAQGALLRVGESALRLAPPGGAEPVGTTPDGEGHVRVTTVTGKAAHPKPISGSGPSPTSSSSSSSSAPASSAPASSASSAPVVPPARAGGTSGAGAPPSRPPVTHITASDRRSGEPREASPGRRSTVRSCRSRAGHPGSRAGRRSRPVPTHRRAEPLPGPRPPPSRAPAKAPRREAPTCRRGCASGAESARGRVG